jgi:hypothetical protein
MMKSYLKILHNNTEIVQYASYGYHFLTLGGDTNHAVEKQYAVDVYTHCRKEMTMDFAPFVELQHLT